MSEIDAVHDENPVATPPETIQETIAALSDSRDVLPTEAVLEARSQWDQFFPRLLEEMRAAIDMAREDEDPGEIAFWGVALIAERNRGEVDESLPVLIEILSLPEEPIDLLIGDLLTELMPQALANAADKQVPLLEGMFADPTIDVYARWAIGNALIRLVAEGVVPRQQIVGLFQTQLQKVLEESGSPTSVGHSDFRTGLIILLQHLLPHEADADMLAAFSRDLVEEFMIDETSVRDRMQQGEPGFEEDMADVRAKRIDDCLAFLEPWFNRQPPAYLPATTADDAVEPDDAGNLDAAGDLDVEDFHAVAAVQTIRREQTKVRRNDPCPCGSGRKFKKCCGQS
jgi:hypothetical protein